MVYDETEPALVTAGYTTNPGIFGAPPALTSALIIYFNGPELSMAWSMVFESD